ncbi:MAG: gluconolactonase [Maritimibacter sp.]|nr:gluconolactonase [Maritimibacter sp.]
MTQRAEVYDTRACELGEGPLWHPERQQLFWFDIVGNRLMTRDGKDALSWSFDEHHSAAGWIDRETLLIASETGLWRFDIASGDRELVAALEADNPVTRSNDGRADPMGGFWIGTMGKSAEPHAGAFYRYYRGELRQITDRITIPNALCFSGDGRTGYYADTIEKRVYRHALDSDGWPEGPAEVFLDLTEDGLNPDGAVIDAEDHLWLALWGAGRGARYRPDGTLVQEVEVGGRNASCPAFGGADLTTLFVTTAQEGLRNPGPAEGRVYCATAVGQGRAEARVVL